MEQKVLDSKLAELKSRIEPKTYMNNANDVSTRLSTLSTKNTFLKWKQVLKMMILT